MSRSRQLQQVVIVSPALADANNGNWRTARRWQRFLSGLASTRIIRHWPDALADDDRAMHARRSAPAIAAWREVRRPGGVGLIRTGSDLYRDILVDSAAQASLPLVGALVVLQGLGPLALPAGLRGKTREIFQSTSSRRALLMTDGYLLALIVGHLREERVPETLFAAAHGLAGDDAVRIDHLGDALDPLLGEAARATMAESANYRWLGGQPHAATRRRIQRAHLLVHASRIEGGAHVVMEAVCSGTPVIASAIDGNIGMLGKDYAGYFACGDAPALAELLVRCRASQGQADGLLARLAAQCRQRAAQFAPAAERSALRQLVADLLARPSNGAS
ncbi:MAG TPA: selenoneine biosynthesis selenosugar synthase SenB [Accumulibacter sp.]|uniref:selenoneine biosynthesis selenosugar synthase SenB n=1 Tax=Accumulibacter sp. TaxID=2053492 RepID=UPI002C281646|nr:selenoneine biosynthesis selenosugar synthase SenB [Accumulibacter sp.]HRD90869.1 selenoneine biosynthesis selenosugar synthase SenB [Accumulibacter sp.]